MECLIVKKENIKIICWRKKEKTDEECFQCLVNTHNEEAKQFKDKLTRRNRQIKELKKKICVDFNICREKRVNLSYCNADFYCSAVGNVPEVKGCMTCEFYNR